MRSRDDAAVTLASVFDHQLRVIELDEQAVFDQLDPEALHRFRVAVRRTRSLERLARSHLPDDMSELWHRDWSWLASRTGPARDLDVLLGVLQQDRSLSELADRAAVVRGRHQLELRAALRGDRYGTLKSGWRAGINELAAIGQVGSECDAAHLAREAITKGSDDLVKAARGVDRKAAPRKIHRVRKRVKRLRYAAELLGGALPRREIDSVVSTTKRLQDVLGAFQDAEVHRTLVNTLLADESLGPLSTDAQVAARAFLASLATNEDVARRDLVDALAPLRVRLKRP